MATDSPYRCLCRGHYETVGDNRAVLRVATAFDASDPRSGLGMSDGDASHAPGRAPAECRQSATDPYVCTQLRRTLAGDQKWYGIRGK
jgi:hypothetical protein